MEEHTFLVEVCVEHIQNSNIMRVKRVEDIRFANKIQCTNNGVYLMKDQDQGDIAIFKPIKEEKTSGSQQEQGYKAHREVAAFLLDHPFLEEKEGFGRVPPTNMVRSKFLNGDVSKEWEQGSLQEYVAHQKWKRDQPSVFAVDDVQRLSLMDMRFGNTDRHAGNILNSNVNRGGLIPIDHGECFPEKWDNYRFIWTSWNQAKSPYPVYMIDYVKRLVVETDLQILKKNGIELGAKSVFVYKIQNEVLKAGVCGGYSPAEIGEFMTGNFMTEKSRTGKPNKKFRDSKGQTIINVMEKCMKHRPEAESEEESQLLKLIHEETKSALDNNKRNKLLQNDEKASTSVH